MLVTRPSRTHPLVAVARLGHRNWAALEASTISSAQTTAALLLRMLASSQKTSAWPSSEWHTAH